jgi:hypothetical protein
MRMPADYERFLAWLDAVESLLGPHFEAWPPYSNYGAFQSGVSPLCYARDLAHMYPSKVC